MASPWTVLFLAIFFPAVLTNPTMTAMPTAQCTNDEVDSIRIFWKDARTCVGNILQPLATNDVRSCKDVNELTTELEEFGKASKCNIRNEDIFNHTLNAFTTMVNVTAHFGVDEISKHIVPCIKQTNGKLLKCVENENLNISTVTNKLTNSILLGEIHSAKVNKVNPHVKDTASDIKKCVGNVFDNDIYCKPLGSNFTNLIFDVLLNYNHASSHIASSFFIMVASILVLWIK